MGLKELQKKHNPRKRDRYCPSCGTKGEETGRLEMKCPAPRSECEVMHWFPGGE